MSSETLIIVLSLLFSAFFSGMAIAFVSSTKIHIEIEKKQSGLLSELLKRITAKPSKFIATMLIGNNIAIYRLKHSENNNHIESDCNDDIDQLVLCSNGNNCG